MTVLRSLIRNTLGPIRNDSGPIRNALGPIIGGGATLQFTFATPDSSGEMQMMGVGTGTPVHTHTADILQPQAPEVGAYWNRFGANVPVWRGARLDGTTPYGTDGSGDPLAQTPYLWFQPGPRTNSQVKSNDIEPPEWTLVTCTSALDAVGIEGVPNTATTLTATANAATAIAAAITDASDDQATQWFIKRKTGTGDIDITLDNGSTWTTVVIDSSFTEIVVDQAALANPEIGIRIATSGDEVIVANSSAFLGLTAEEVNGLGPIITAGAGAATDMTVYQYDSDNHSPDSGIYFFELYMTQASAPLVNPSSGFARIIQIASTSWIGVRAATGEIRAYIGNLDNMDSSNSVDLGANKVALIYTADGNLSINLNGTYTDGAFSGVFPATRIDIGTNTDFCFGLRNGKHYSGISSLAEGKAIVDELMA